MKTFPGFRPFNLLHPYKESVHMVYRMEEISKSNKIIFFANTSRH